MFRKTFQTLSDRVGAINWKTWVAIIVISIPLFLLNVPGQRVGLVDSAQWLPDFGKEFSHGWPCVAANSLKPNYDIEEFRDRSIDGPKQYSYPTDVVSNFGRGSEFDHLYIPDSFAPSNTNPQYFERHELKSRLNQGLRESFFWFDPTHWNKETNRYMSQRRNAFTLRKAPGLELDQTSHLEWYKPSWWYTESWPADAIGLKFFWPGLILNLTVWIVICFLVGGIAELANHYTPGIFRFRLRNLLVGVTAVSLVFASGINVRQQFLAELAAADKLKEAGAHSTFEKTGFRILRPTWLLKLIGTGWDQSFYRIRNVEFFKYTYSKQDITEINRQMEQLPRIEYARIKATAAKKHDTEFEFLHTSSHLQIDVNDWYAVSKLETDLSKLKTLTLFDLEYRLRTWFVLSESSAERRSALENLAARGFQGTLILEGSGSLTKAELKTLGKLSVSNLVLKQCTVCSESDLQWVKKYQMEVEDVRVDPFRDRPSNSEVMKLLE